MMPLTCQPSAHPALMPCTHAPPLHQPMKQAMHQPMKQAMQQPMDTHRVHVEAEVVRGVGDEEAHLVVLVDGAHSRHGSLRACVQEPCVQ